MWGLDIKQFDQFLQDSEMYVKLKALKLTDKMQKIVQLLFVEELDPNERNRGLMLKFAEENFKGIKITEIKEKVAAQIMDLAVTDYKAEIKKCKVDKDFVAIAKKHLDEVVAILKDSDVDKYPSYEKKHIWDGKKLTMDFYDLSAEKLLNMVRFVGQRSKEELALKLHQLVMVIPDVKKCLADKKE
jgi:hypothetical protein